MSSLGKGIAASALGALLQARGHKVRLRKLDPYLNVDPGTMSPFQHGEVFVTDDGTESDMDLGHYERFTGVASTANDSTTAGRIYSNVLAKERRGDYLGATIQVVPHIIDEIKAFILTNETDADFVICEIGGTVGDIESLPFLEATRQLRLELGRERTLFAHVTLLPYIASAGELKTKPTQHSVRDLLSVGIQPDILLCRSDRDIPEEARRKLGLFCNVQASRVIEARDVQSIYQVPLCFEMARLDEEVCLYFDLPTEPSPDLTPWRQLVRRILHPQKQVTIGIVGKYVQFADAYKSLVQAIIHAGAHHDAHVKIQWIDSSQPAQVVEHLKNVQGILVPGGFGERGAEGKIAAIKWARENNKPFLGICFGMQLAIIEAARNLLGLKEASSTEFGPTPEPVVALLTEWMDRNLLQKRQEGGDLGGTMRLGAYPCALKPLSLAQRVYGQSEISERHRHRFEVNMTYKERFEEVGLLFSGTSLDGELPEIVEHTSHPWFIGVQFHPELLSKPFQPHPLFVAFIGAALAQPQPEESAEAKKES